MNQAEVYEYLEKTGLSERADILLVNSDKDAEVAAGIADFLDIPFFVLPQIRVNPGEDLRSYCDEIRQLFFALGRYYECDSIERLLIAPFATLSIPLPKKECFSTLSLEFAQTVDRKKVSGLLHRWGYHFVDIVTAPSEVSIRGDIIDIYSPSADLPWRINLFDEEIESIYEFDPSTQKKMGDELEKITIYPAFLALSSDEYEKLRYRIEMSSYESFVKDIDSLGLWLLGPLSENLLAGRKAIMAYDFNREIDEFYALSNPLIDRSSFPDLVIPRAKIWSELEVANVNSIIQTHKDKDITIVARSESLVRGSGIDLGSNLRFVYKRGVLNLRSKERFILSLNKNIPSTRRRAKRPKIVLDELKSGDYVVHENHGVGIFKGIEKRDVLGAEKEFIVIKYLNDDTLLVPVESLNLIDRYIAEGGTLPSIDRLGKSSFRKLKEKTKKKLFEIASHIISLSAKRMLNKGKVIKVDFAEHAVFLSQAGFEHTEDQMRSIREIFEELKSGLIMDRLLSADVGFGKTEVAMNAIFATVRSGYQAMIVVPTTLLSAQHYNSLKERFEKWEIGIARLDRYTSTRDRRAVLSGLSDGSIDVVVGTHALLKVQFRDLGLIVVDEEHKFGVKQKESLKQRSLNVHMLSMSATPIPRSLNMALSKIKTFSEILTAPLERTGVRTFVKSYDPKVVKEAIQRERRRGGQVFYVHNSIADIEEKALRLREILPDLRLAVLHSKISATKIEDEMMRFEAGEYDLLLSTTIVESGIHLPNANTIIVDGAERFGIADLHQLRGRVGRSSKEGYCYFLVEDKENLQENARRRLLALETHSELGSGTVLAFHDLEIRGGGNLIGEAQSGHIKQIGYSLYLKMLEEAIRQLSGDDLKENPDVEIKLQVNAYLSDELINEDRLRLELYRRLAHAESVEEVYEIEEEIADRFGKPDEMTSQFIRIMALKVMARERCVCKISSYQEKVFVEFTDGRDRKTVSASSRDDDDVMMATMRLIKELPIKNSKN